VRESLPPPIPCKIIMTGVLSGMEGSSLKSSRSSTPSGVSTVCTCPMHDKQAGWCLPAGVGTNRVRQVWGTWMRKGLRSEGD
jgi:hypothetical protein